MLTVLSFFLLHLLLLQKLCYSLRLLIFLMSQLLYLLLLLRVSLLESEEPQFDLHRLGDHRSMTLLQRLFFI